MCYSVLCSTKLQSKHNSEAQSTREETDWLTYFPDNSCAGLFKVYHLPITRILRGHRRQHNEYTYLLVVCVYIYVRIKKELAIFLFQVPFMNNEVPLWSCTSQSYQRKEKQLVKDSILGSGKVCEHFCHLWPKACHKGCLCSSTFPPVHRAKIKSCLM